MRTRILQKIFRLLVVLLIILLVGYGINLIFPYFSQFEIPAIAPIITGAITLIVGLGAVLITQTNIKKRQLAEAHRESKIKLYNSFNDKIFELFAGINDNVTGEPPNEKELTEFMMKFKKELMFRASPKVIKALIKFEKYSNNPRKKASILRYVDDIYKAMRKDIGLSNYKLDNLEMIQIFLKDKSDKWKIK